MTSVATSSVALATGPKNKLIDRIAQCFNEELVKLQNDASFKSSPTVTQVAAQSEFVQWFQCWFDRMPGVDKPSHFPDLVRIEPDRIASRPW